jgi:hypothetical protein
MMILTGMLISFALGVVVRHSYGDKARDMIRAQAERNEAELWAEIRRQRTQISGLIGKE